MTKEEVLNWVENDFIRNANREFGEILVTAGAGDVDLLVKPIADMLKRI